MSSVDLGTGGADVVPSSCMERLANGLTPAVCHTVTPPPCGGSLAGDVWDVHNISTWKSKGNIC